MRRKIFVKKKKKLGPPPMGVTHDERSKRRLPLWMGGVAAADHLSGDAEANNIGEGPVPKSRRSKATILTSEPENLGGQDILETKKRKRDLTEKKKQHNVVARKVPRRKRKETSVGSESGEGFEISSPSDDDGELTVQDLLSLAKEYVKFDEGMEQEQLPNGKLDRGSVMSHDSENCSTAQQRKDFCDSNGGLASEHSLISGRRTGDPAQDMLDLFLGPLLNKPTEEKKHEYLTNDMEFSYGFKKQSQTVVSGEELVPPVKRKSSLKDKVAMLLD